MTDGVDVLLSSKIEDTILFRWSLRKACMQNYPVCTMINVYLYVYVLQNEKMYPRVYALSLYILREKV